MKDRIFALVDCDNFFVSCERLFRPDLEGRPVVVLSSNDGCAVARSNEAKALGIAMAAPAFKYRDVFERHDVVKFSANFELYGDISRRITDLLTTITPRLEIYSIDESFLDLSELIIDDYDAWGRMVRQRVMEWIGIPVSVGIAPTKTLAKLAVSLAKKQPGLAGVLSLYDHCERLDLSHPLSHPAPANSANRQLKPGLPVRGLTSHSAERLESLPVEDVWGVGWRLAPKLRAAGVHTALDLSRLRPRHAGQLLGVHGRQLVAELNGVSCLPLQREGQPRQSIARTRTFGEDTADFAAIEAALAMFVTRAAYRLREDNRVTRRVGLFLQTSKHKPGFRSWDEEVRLDIPTADTGQLLSAAVGLLKQIYQPRQSYHRAGIRLRDFLPADSVQTDLLGVLDSPRYDRSVNRMRAMDGMNRRFGRGSLGFAAEKLNGAWQPKQKLRSPRYVSDWAELPVAYTHTRYTKKP